jgi:hypothetical protein
VGLDSRCLCRYRAEPTLRKQAKQPEQETRDREGSPIFSEVVRFPREGRRQMPPTLRAAPLEEAMAESLWRRVLLFIALAIVVAIVLAGELSRLPLFHSD